MEEANKLIGTGKKHLVMGKVVEAVSTLQEASGMLAKEFGDTADECGEAFFWYGKALLDLARMENSVLGNALEGVPEEEEEKPKDSNVESTDNVDEKTRDELRVQVYDAMAEKKTEDGEKVEGKQSEDPQEKTEGAEAGDKKENTEKVEGEAEKDNKNDESKSESKDKKEKSGEEVDAKDDSEPAAKEKEGDSAAAKKEKTAAKEEEPAEKMDSAAEEEEAAAEEEADGEEDEEEGGDDVEMEGDAEEQGEGDATGEKDSDDEEVGNLQLAWEMLEVAKVIYKRKETKEAQLMAAQAHLKLGEVSAESGNYPQALEDFQECLKLQVKHLDSDSRLLAETRYQLGVTYSLNTQYSEAIESLKSSISIIKNRLDKLQEMLDKAEGPEALPEERKELEELKALLPEIQEKVEDATESLKTASAAVKDALDGGSTSSACDGSTVKNRDSSSTSEIKSTSTSNGNTSTAAVSDISHLVRKKRKPEESPVKEDVKKVKQDNSQPGETLLTNGDAGEHANDMEVESK
ncbi:histone-binding protein N1/N2-like [Astatotilapia calliptera]|uniref:histone-binding protein N1/N2-like n=1 Tax=Astatotilapia calliptera TaxID=8154 RepID=UPI000E409B8A|nr:histone-binding protein N1/N2-like [Astatotilapia calliptera]